MKNGMRCQGMLFIATQNTNMALFHFLEIAWDWVNQKMYWVDECLGVIEFYDPSTKWRTMLIAGLPDPYGIVVDPTTG